MENLILIINIILAVLLVVIVLLQKSEGGALGIGGGSDGMNPRGAADALTRTTAIIATLFIITSISLTILSLRSNDRTLSFDDEVIELPDEIEDLPELPQLD